MTPIGLFYGSNTDCTRLVVDQVVEEFKTIAPDLLDIHDIATDWAWQLVDEFDLVRYLEPIPA